MNVALVGYGKMGRQIEKVLIEKKINLISTIDSFSENAKFKELNSESLSNVDVVIDFSSPDGIMNRIDQYIKNNVNVVMGTTGWYDKKEEVKMIIQDKIGFIWSGNFSLGVHIFFRIIRNASKIFNNFSDYDSLGYEIHHNEKKDSPSGTELMIGDIMLNELNNKKNIVTERLDRKIEKEEIHLSSVRGGSFPGTHVVMFDSSADTIELKHTARNREGFAYGAVMVSQWVKGRKGFFSIDDYLESII
jgi:4-hydroxy-tetrahydrodipicolinate reductase